MKLGEATNKATRPPIYIDEGSSHSRTTAALLEHWYNHGPKLLEALKAVRDCASTECEQDCGTFCCKDLVAAAEEVEGI